MQTVLTNRANPLRRFMSWDQSALLIAMCVVIVFFSLQAPYFFTPLNFLNVFKDVSISLTAGVGMTVLLLVGEVDLSIGSTVGLIGVIVCHAVNATGSAFVAFLAAIGVGAAIGLINALIVTRLNVNSLICTLGMMTILRGITMIITRAVAVQVLVDNFKNLSAGSILSIPIPIFMIVIVFVLFFFLLQFVTFGRYVYACGDNGDAAKAAGLDVKKIKTVCFMICSILASVAGVILAAKMNSGQPNAGVGFEFAIIAAVILGGTSLSGGKGSLLGSLIGITLLRFVTNGMIMMNIDSYWQNVVSGSVIILAVALDSNRARRKEMDSEKLVKLAEEAEES